MKPSNAAEIDETITKLIILIYWWDLERARARGSVHGALDGTVDRLDNGDVLLLSHHGRQDG